MTIRVSKTRVDMDGKDLERPVLKDYGETVITANSGSSYTIDLTQGNVFNITLTDDCAFTFATDAPSGVAVSFTLILTQDETGDREVTWPGAVVWLAGEPELLATAESFNVLIFLTVTGGTTWYGATGGGVLPPPTPLQYGWFGGGASTVDRIDYANDTATASVRGPLSAARYYLAATGTSAYGWFGGGLSPSIVSRVDRIDYANDTATASVRGPLSAARWGPAATGTSAYGWFGGGSI